MESHGFPFGHILEPNLHLRVNNKKKVGVVNALFFKQLGARWVVSSKSECKGQIIGCAF